MSEVGFILNRQKSYAPIIDNLVAPILNNFDAPFEFHKSIPAFSATPLLNLPALAERLSLGSIWVKDEGVRFGTSAIKILGASYAINHISNQQSIIKGICTATDGNHGKAVAWVANQNSLPAVIFVPKHTVQSRIDNIVAEGATVIVSKDDYDQAVNEASEFASKNNFALVQDTSWLGYTEIPATITAGYYTQMHEICCQTSNLFNPAIDLVFIQAGVGSWPSAVVHFIRKKLGNKVKIVCVEPYESDAIYESIKRNSLASTRKSQKTIMAGLNCGTPSALAFEILKNGVDAFLVISDRYAIDAIRYLNAPLPGDPYVSAGESGAAGLAGLLALTNNLMLNNLKEALGLNKNSNILLFNTENVTDPVLMDEIMKSINSD